VIKGQVGSEYKVSSHENGLKIYKKLGIFPKMGVSPKNGLRFLRGALDAVAILEVSSWHMPIAPCAI